MIFSVDFLAGSFNLIFRTLVAINMIFWGFPNNEWRTWQEPNKKLITRERHASYKLTFCYYFN